VFLLAAILGLAAAAMVWSYLSGQESQAHAQTQVVTAASNIPRGMVLTAAKLRIRSFPSHLVTPGAAVDEKTVVGKVAKTDIKAGEPIYASHLAANDRLSYAIPPFMRAVTVGLDPVIGVGGFLKPGDRVDVVATFDVNGNSFARTVLQNVHLLAIGKEYEGGGNVSADKAAARTQPTATLAVTPTDAEKLVLADAKGRLRLALRSDGDASIRPVKPVSAQAVIGVAPKPSNQGAGQSRSVKSPAPRFVPPLIAEPTVRPAPLSFESEPFPRQMPAAVSSGKTIVIVRGTQTEEATVSE